MSFGSILIFFIIGCLLGLIISMPTIIASARGIRMVDIKVIAALSVLGVLLFPFWIIAFILALVYRPEK